VFKKRPPQVLLPAFFPCPLSQCRWGRSLCPWNQDSSVRDGTCGSECRLSDRILRTCLNPPIFAGRVPDGFALPADRSCCDRQSAQARPNEVLSHCDDALAFLAL